jgi:transcription antitermination factor NusG
MSSLNWYALRIESRFAAMTSQILRNKGYEEYFPTYRCRQRWSDRIKDLEKPLVPGYIFCRFDPQEHRTPILTTPGVIAFVGIGKKPSPIPDGEIDAIRTIVHSGLSVNPQPFIERGARVLIERGPLSGLEGIVLDADKTCRLVVSISLLQRSVAVEIDRGWVRLGPAANA